MDSRADVARIGVRKRLVYATLSTLMTLLSVFGFFFGVGPVGAIGFLGLSVAGLIVTVALLQNARREEAVHELAMRPAPRQLVDDGADGTV